MAELTPEEMTRLAELQGAEALNEADEAELAALVAKQAA